VGGRNENLFLIIKKQLLLGIAMSVSKLREDEEVGHAVEDGSSKPLHAIHSA
jgi:hypothetical protein